MNRFDFDAIGTHWTVTTDRPLPDETRRATRELVSDFDRTWSRFRPDSLVRRIAAAPRGGSFTFPPDAAPLFDLYDLLHQMTDGAVDPLVGRDLELLGYDDGYSLTPAPVAEREDYARTRPRWTTDVDRNGTIVHTTRPLVLDVGAAGKGRLVDLVTERLRTDGIDTVVVDGGGDLRHRGPAPVRVGLEDPNSPERVLGVLNLRDQALCASSTHRRSWGPGLHHVLDARTGHPVQDVVATWAVADTAALADGLATALFFVPPARLGCLDDTTALRLHATGVLDQQGVLDGELFTTERITKERTHA